MIKGKIHSVESMGLVDGPGIRVVVFMQGCALRCLYCHNPDTWTLDGNKFKYISKNKQIEREIVTYHVILEYKFAEISQITKKPIGTVLWIYNKAMKVLKSRIGELYE